MPNASDSKDAALTGAEVFLPAAGDSRALRTMKIVVIVLGLALVLGFFTVVGRMIYLTARPDASPAARSDAPGSTAMPSAPPISASPLSANPISAGTIPLPLPEGAEVRHLAMDGTRLAVHYSTPTGAGTIVVVDTAAGRVISRIELQQPRQGAPSAGMR